MGPGTTGLTRKNFNRIWKVTDFWDRTEMAAEAGAAAFRMEQLNKRNFETWKIHMKAMLIKGGNYKFISDEPPEDAAALELWKNGDEKAMSDIILCIHPTELKQVKNCSTTKEIWNRLNEIYKSTGPARKATLLKSLLQKRMKEGETDIHGYMRDFFDVVDQLQELDITIDDELLTIMLLYSLSNEYENFRVAIESRDELPKPDALRIKIIEEFNARRNGNHGNTTVSGAFFATAGRRRNFAPPPPRPRSSRNNDTRQCWKCKKIGHISSKCPNSVPHPRSYNVECNTAQLENLFILDSGSTGHFLSKKELFHTLDDTAPKLLRLADNSSTEIRGTGDATLNFATDNHIKEFNVDDAMLVPNLRNNLLSISKICDKGYIVTFDASKVTLRNGPDVIVGERQNDLYCLRTINKGDSDPKMSASMMASSSMDTKSKFDFLKLHYRYGHASTEILKTLKFKDLGTLPPAPPDFTCEVCIKGKLCRASFPNTHRRSKTKLEIIHTDLCGPISTKSNGGSSYFVTFTDESTDWTEVRFLKHKSETFSVFKDVQKLLERQSDKKIKFVQSDRGMEYLGEKFNNFLRELGIARRLSVKHTPEQNGRSERKNRTLLDIARCLLIQSGLPDRFWAEAIATANHVKNRTPSKTLNGKTPYELWFDREPNVGYFKVFGCEAFVWNNSKTKTKFEPRALKGIFLGYDDQSKAYRVYLHDKNRIEITRSVKFLENKYLKPTRKDVNVFPFDDDIDQCDKDTQTINISFLNPVNNNLGDNVSNDQICDDNVSNDTPMDNVPNDQIGEEMKRAPGRPKNLKSGRPGRPKKVYKTVPVQSVNDNSDETSFVCSMLATDEISLEKAINSSDSSVWIEAIASEIESVIKNDTFEIVSKPGDVESVGGVIGSRFILREKNVNGKIKKKARLIAQGFGQIPDINYFQNQTFSPVARLSSVRLIAALSSKLKVDIHQFDITTAYLNGILDETVYMKIPKYFESGLEYIIDNGTDINICDRAVKMLNDIKQDDKVCLLKKSLYGLKQSGRCWYLKLKEILLNFGLVNTVSDPCVFHMSKNNMITILTVYVDDLLLISEDPDIVQQLHSHLSESLDVKYIGKAKTCLGIEFNNNENVITMSQKNYITKLLEKFNMSECNGVDTPMEIGLKLTKAEKHDDTFPYRELIGSLNYLAVCTRPDISYSVSKLSQYLNCCDKVHWNAAKRVLKYLKKTINHGLIFNGKGMHITGFTDSDWGNDTEDRRSYSGFCFTLCGGVVSWESRKQRTVALSSTEAEYMSLSDGCKEALYLQKLLQELKLGDFSKVKLNVDNHGALKLAESTVYHNRTKHIDIRYHFIRDVTSDCISLEHISTNEMTADVLTKPLSSPKHHKCLNLLNVKDILDL